MSSLPLCKLCEIEDFAIPEIRSLIRTIHPPPVHDPNFPTGHEARKAWEIAQAVRALTVGGAVTPAAELLGVGAGAEQTTFWLTRHAWRVFSTDLYLTPGEWGEQAAPEMLVDPGSYAAGPWNPKRLVVQHMEARELRYEDASFDGVYSCGSIEHFGTLADVTTAAHEMCRVLKPGGIAAISTEYRLAGAGELPGILMFDKQALHDVIIDPPDWELLEPLDLRISTGTMATIVSFERAADESVNGKEWSQWPHIVLEHAAGVRWTSVALALRRHR